MTDKNKVHQYKKDHVTIKIEYTGLYIPPENSSGCWTLLDDGGCNTESGLPDNIDMSYPVHQYKSTKDKYDFPRLRELAPHPADDEILYTEADINKKYFLKETEMAFASRKKEPKAPEQVRVTNESETSSMSVDLQFANMLLDFVPEKIADRITLFENKMEIYELSEFDTNRILELIPDLDSEEFSNKPIMVYLGTIPEHDSFTTDMSAKGIISLLKSEQVYTDLACYRRLNRNGIGDLYENLKDSISQIKTYVLDTFADLKRYDKNIDLFELIKLYDNIGTNYVQHNNGRQIFDTFVKSNSEFVKVIVNVCGDMHTGYYSNHILFIPDCEMNYLRMYSFDVLDTEDDLFNSEHTDPKDIANSVADIEFSDIILDNIREVLFMAYKEQFIKYNAPEGITEDTSRDV